ncbi:hypothetical protein [Jiulongibacter sediminis]|uniref:VWFA domain-containing protein n=1 Tax=Jiulongibacter sediminis TaxID=1605367 RepID=A0A0P7BUN1_9BACT|nr:hypothetical protein [Jiulongibacter sediminis]KPM48520.1 hypothetical protein AFM12_07815 [Jiulongibacter sediminis]TBX25059.1 hypothetical protein TK44_07820 [Jiulongibacter sediminis]
MRVFLSLALGLLLFSCSDSETTTESSPSKPIHTLIFMDKTSSVDVSKPFVAQKYQQLLKQVVDENIRQAGDQIDIYFVHENTAKGKSISLTSRTEKENTQGMNATDLEAAQTGYEMTLQKEKNIFIRQCLAQLNKKNGGSSNAETDLKAAIPILSEAAADGSEVKAYFLSDMVQSQKNGRDFHKNAPTSSDQANQWAEEDLSQFEEANLLNCDIQMVLPFEPTSSSSVNNPNITVYWQSLLGDLGAGVSEL